MKMQPYLVLFIVFLAITFAVYALHFKSKKIETSLPEEIDESKLEKATFAGGCFWCTESTYEQFEGVYKVTSGYTGGEEKDPTYEQVSSGATSHRESIQILYNPKEITYNDLLEIYWRQIDPTDAEGSFVDRGFQYTSAIFYHNVSQKKQAEASLKKLEESGKYDKPIATKIIKATEFYPAEEYHQDYYKKSPLKYKFYRSASGRDQYREATWGDDKDYVLKNSYKKPSDEELKEMLTPIQYKVTQKDGTEPAFKNEYWDNHEEGIYVDIVSGEALFSSIDKFDSGTGWPSFTKTINKSNVIEKEDNTFFTTRTEVRSKKADSHLGHIFLDGPLPSRIRYCMNSAALRFIPKTDMKKEGYEEYLKLFE